MNQKPILVPKHCWFLLCFLFTYIFPVISYAVPVEKIVYHTKGGIWMMNPDGSNPQPLTVNDTDVYPNLSHDGRRLAFSSNRDGHYDIWVLDFSTGLLNNLTPDDNENDLSPTWSSDDLEIAFSSRRDGNYGAIFKISSSGGSLTQLTFAPAADIWPDWNQITDQIIYQSMEGQYNFWAIWEVDSEGNGLENKLIPGSLMYFPRYSPNGNMIAWNNSRQLWIADASGTNSLRIPTGSLDVDMLTWSPDGNSIAFSSMEGNSYNHCCPVNFL